MADGSTNKLLDREELRHAIRGEYEEVALTPAQGFHFHTGRPLAGILGYQDDCLEGIPETSIESFDGPGNPFSAVEIKPGEKVANFGIQVIYYKEI
jgi:arsenite methyltransferase